MGSRDVPADALWGIHTLRAMENFPLARPAGASAAGPCLRRGQAGRRADQPRTGPLGRRQRFAAIEAACREMIDGRLDEHVVVDALQGGAGTSTNMNVNEVLANRALQLLGRPLGDYADVSPHDDINLHQSTNDTYPTALRVAAISALRDAGTESRGPGRGVSGKGKTARADVVKIGRTELQDAVLLTLGREMAAYAEAVGPRPLAHLQVRGAAAGGEPRRHGRRHRARRTAAIHLPRRRTPAANHRPGAGPGRKPRRGHAERRRLRRGQRHRCGRWP